MKYFFVSDVHLGLSYNRPVWQTEELFESFLLKIKDELLAHEDSQKGLFLVGDIFDFWFEYKNVIPKGFVTVFSILKTMAKEGIDIFMLKGNHDCWSRGYLSSLGIKFIEKPEYEFKINDINLYISHGDRIQSQSKMGSKLMYHLFNSKIAYRLFTFLVHPDLAMWFGNKWSQKNRNSKYVSHKFKFEDEPIVKFIRNRKVSNNETSYYIFGHLHTPIMYDIDEKSTIMILGQWIEGDIYYGVLDNEGLRLELLKP